MTALSTPLFDLQISIATTSPANNCTASVKNLRRAE